MSSNIWVGFVIRWIGDSLVLAPSPRHRHRVIFLMVHMRLLKSTLALQTFLHKFTREWSTIFISGRFFPLFWWSKTCHNYCQLPHINTYCLVTATQNRPGKENQRIISWHWKMDCREKKVCSISSLKSVLCLIVDSRFVSNFMFNKWSNPQLCIWQSLRIVICLFCNNHRCWNKPEKQCNCGL